MYITPSPRNYDASTQRSTHSLRTTPTRHIAHSLQLTTQPLNSLHTHCIRHTTPNTLHACCIRHTTPNTLHACCILTTYPPINRLSHELQLLDERYTTSSLLVKKLKREWAEVTKDLGREKEIRNKVRYLLYAFHQLNFLLLLTYNLLIA